MAQSHVEIVRKRLKGYAERGVFSGFEERPARAGKTEFTFEWLLQKPFTMVLDEKAGTLQLKNLLPEMPAKSDLYREVKIFVEDRSGKGLPTHRRIDPKRAELTCSNRASRVSFKVLVKRNQYAYGLGRLLNFTNELFGNLEMYHIQYLWEHFDLPEE